MSRLLSFLKKKDKDVGLEYSGSPPPSPKSDKEPKEVKSVKQIKKRHHRRDKRKAPLPQAGVGTAPVVVVQQESLGHCLVEDTIDANGNSMTGKGKTTSLDNGDLAVPITTLSTEGEADSLRDVDSICDDEATNGIVGEAEIDNTVVSAEPYFGGGVDPDMGERRAAENGTGESSSPAPTPLPVASEECDTNGGPGLKYVSSFSDSGDNILIDDFMDEALDDLEDTDDNLDDLNVTVESSDTTDQAESSVRLATPVNSYPEAGSSNVECNFNLPCENGSLLDSVSNGITGADVSDHSISVCAERLLSTDTVGTVYSSCDAGSDYFESAFEELPASINGDEQSKVLLAANGCDDSDAVNVSIRPKSTSCATHDLHSSAEFTDADVSKLEVCFEVESQGRTSTIVADIVEARNCLVETEVTETAEQNNMHDESADPIEVSIASDTLRQNSEASNKEVVASSQNNIDEDNDEKATENEVPIANSAVTVTELPEESARKSLHLIDDTVTQSEPSEVRTCDPSVVSDTKDVRDRPVSVGAEVETNGESSQTLDDSPVNVGNTDNLTEHSDRNLVNGDDLSEVDKEDVVENIVPDNACRNDTGVVNDTGCEEHTCDETSEGIPEKEKCSVDEDTDNTTTSDDRGMSPAHDPAASNTNGDVRALHSENGVIEGGEVEPQNTDLVGKEQSEQSQCEPTLNSDVAAGEATVIVNGSKQVTDELQLSLNVTADSEVIESSPVQATCETPMSPDDSSSSATLSTPSGSSRKSSRALKKEASLEDELEKHGATIDNKAEAQLAQRRAARAEARELRLKELERQQQQNPQENTDDASDMSDGGSGGRLGGRSSASRTPAPSAVPPPPPLPHYSRRSSEESNNDEPACKDVRELEEKFRVAMINNASLDNDKTRLTFQIEELKDCRTDLTEQLTQLKKEHKKKCSEHEQLRKVYAKLQEESRAVRRVLEERDELIQEFGLVVVGGGDEDEEDGDEEEDEALAAREETEDGLVLPRPVPMKRVLLTQEAAEILQQGAAKGSLEWRLRRVVERKRELEDELRRVNLELAEQVNTQRQSNCIDSNIQKEANKTVNEYKFRVQKAEAEVSSLQANVNRLEALVTRYKAQTEELERSEEELKAEKRRLQRELREATNRLDELETANSHLVRRFELLRNARSNLLREMSQDPI